MNQISDFYENTTKVFSGVITHNGSNPDTTNDVVKFTVKAHKNDDDDDAIIDKDAVGLGVGGIFTVALTAEETIIPAAKKTSSRVYYCELTWLLSGGAGEYVLAQGEIKIEDRYQDVP